MLAGAAAVSARGAVMRRIGGETAPLFRAQVRAIANAGIPVGSLAAAVAVQMNTRAAYSALILLNSATFLACALLLIGRVPRLPPLPRPVRERRWSALADRPFVAFTAVNGILAMQAQVPLLPLPIWVATHTDAPRWIISACLALNTVLCVLFQVRFGAKVDTLRTGASAMRSAGLMFLVSCPLMAVLADVPAWLAVTLALAAIAVHTAGELWQSSASYTVCFELAPDHAQGQYQGLLGMGAGAGNAIAPALLIFLCVDGGQAGWLALGALFAGAGLAAGPVVGWAERSRPGLAPVPPPAAVEAPRPGV